MNNYGSPYGSTPGGAEYYYEKNNFGSPSPTPSPRGPGAYYYASTPQQPATRSHFRYMSSGNNDYPSPRPAAFSPRYTSDGLYATNAATANVSGNSRSARKQSFSNGNSHNHGAAKRERRNSYSYYRASDPHGESDEDEYVEVDGITYVIPAKSAKPKSKRHHVMPDRPQQDYYYSTNHLHNERGGHGTDPRFYFAQKTPSRRQQEDFDRRFRDPPRFTEDPRRPPPLMRRSSHSTPQRPQTARPASSHHRQPHIPRKATEADAKRHRIPPGYSLKNWDPTEEPILLLGSVFDANSLGKWIYDWTVYHHGPSTPISDMSGEMWLLLIQLAGKIKRAEECVPRIRSLDNREMVEDFVESGERLTDKLRKLLKACEVPMLKASKKKDAALGKSSGVEFVETLFGRERELEKTEQFMQSVRLWNLRFDANCDEIIRKPTM